ncbi:MAG: diguanylate cyclase [Rubrivivax sp.]
MLALAREQHAAIARRGVQVDAPAADERRVDTLLPTLLRRWLALALCLAAWQAPASAQTLLLDAATRSAPAWPALRMLADPSGTLTAAQVLARRAAFSVPDGPHANLGPRAEPVWLLLSLRSSADAPSQWMLSVDYPSIDRVDVYQPSQPDAAVQVIGRALPFALHPVPSAVHAARLTLAPGQAHELLLRVHTRSTMVLPITLSTPDAFYAAEAGRQLLQGLMSGAMLCLLLYGLTQWVSVRDGMFLAYALVTAGTGLFFFSYSGLGPQHLWGGNQWLSVNLAPLSVLFALVGACWFVERVLEVRQTQPWIARTLHALGLAGGLAALAFMAGLIDYPVAQRVATALGPLPMLLAIPVAWRRARSGQRVGAYMLLGWGAYGVATLTMAALLRGWVGANPWTENAFQAGAMFEMLMWMRVLAVRLEDLRASAQRAHIERDALRSLALTDALTGLPNRRGLSELLARSLALSSPQRPTAVYLLDLDGFKAINDRLGHEAGDELLVGVARRLQSLLRSGDTVARLGGDEFVVVAGGLGGDADAQALGRKLLDSFQQPFTAAGEPCRVGLTIGYALAPLDGQDAQSLLKRADAAMYAGKHAGRHCLRRGQASVGLAMADA